MPERVSAWAVYEPFALKDGRQIFVGITTDGHWQRFCALVGWQELLADPGLGTNNGRVAARGHILPYFADLFGSLTQEDAVALCEQARIPFTPIARPEDLFHDPHLAATGGLMATRLPGGVETRLPRLPIHMGEADLSLRSDPPEVGADTAKVLETLGYQPDAIAALAREGVVAMAGATPAGAKR